MRGGEAAGKGGGDGHGVDFMIKVMVMVMIIVMENEEVNWGLRKMLGNPKSIQDGRF